MRKTKQQLIIEHDNFIRKMKSAYNDRVRENEVLKDQLRDVSLKFDEALEERNELLINNTASSRMVTELKDRLKNIKKTNKGLRKEVSEIRVIAQRAVDDVVSLFYRL